jgi:hypothetical protein
MPCMSGKYIEGHRRTNFHQECGLSYGVLPRLGHCLMGNGECKIAAKIVPPLLVHSHRRGKG